MTFTILHKPYHEFVVMCAAFITFVNKTLIAAAGWLGKSIDRGSNR